MKRLVRKANKEQVSKAKELCKAIKFALEKNDRDKLLELKDEISLYHPSTIYSGKIYRAIFLDKDNFEDNLSNNKLKKAIKDAIYIDGSVVSFSKTKEGAKSGALDWNGNKKNAYLVIVSQYGQGLDLNEFAKTCKEMFDGVKQNIQKDKQLPNGKKNDFKNKFNNVSKEMKNYYSGKYEEVDEVIDVLNKDYKIEQIIDMDKK